MGIIDMFNKKKKNKEIDQLVTDIYTSNPDPERDRRTVQLFKDAGFSREQAEQGIAYLYGQGTDALDIELTQENIDAVGRQTSEMTADAYDSVKSNLTNLEGVWRSLGGNTSLSDLLWHDVNRLVAFLSVLNLEISQYSVDLVNTVFRSDQRPITAEVLRQYASSMKIMELIYTKTVTDEIDRALSAFSDNDTLILSAMKAVGTVHPVAPVLQLYSLLLCSIGLSMAPNRRTPQFYIGLNNYLRYQFAEIERHHHIVLPEICYRCLQIVNKNMEAGN